MKKYRFTIIAISIIAILTIVYLIFDPAKSAWFPRCPFLVLTGLKCPGCGSQRVIHSLLNGDIASAWHCNALLVASLPIIFLYCYAELTRTHHPALYNRLNSIAAIRSTFAIIMAWWVARNIFGW